MSYIIEGYDAQEQVWKTVPYWESTPEGGVGVEHTEYPLKYMAEQAVKLMERLWGGEYGLTQSDSHETLV